MNSLDQVGMIEPAGSATSSPSKAIPSTTFFDINTCSSSGRVVPSSATTLRNDAFEVGLYLYQKLPNS